MRNAVSEIKANPATSGSGRWAGKSVGKSLPVRKRAAHVKRVMRERK
ncbi:MAG TPA: hypothetical protein VMV74_07130 [Bacteroidales bacterium]|nr:hypothetical protein [Bacteroidales bacterium]